MEQRLSTQPACPFSFCTRICRGDRVENSKKSTGVGGKPYRPSLSPGLLRQSWKFMRFVMQEVKQSEARITVLSCLFKEVFLQLICLFKKCFLSCKHLNLTATILLVQTIWRNMTFVLRLKVSWYEMVPWGEWRWKNKGVLVGECTFKCLCDIDMWYNCIVPAGEGIICVSCFLTGCFGDALKSQGSPEYKHTSLEGLGTKLSTFKHIDQILLQ